MFDIMLAWTWMAFSHIRGDVSNQQSSNQENEYHCWPHIVGLAKGHPNNVEVAIYMDLGYFFWYLKLFFNINSRTMGYIITKSLNGIKMNITQHC